MAVVSQTPMIPHGDGPSSYRLPEMTQDTPRITFVLADTDFNPEKGTYSWLDNENHTINLNGTSAATTYNEMKEWIGTINSSTTWARERDPNIPEVADDLGENFSSGRTKGYEFGKNRS